MVGTLYNLDTEITVTETWADGSHEDVRTVHEEHLGQTWHTSYAPPEGYMAHVWCKEPIAINYLENYLYLHRIRHDFEIVISYTPE